MKKTALITLMLVGSSLASAQTVRELRDSVSNKLDRVNNNRSVLMNMNRYDLEEAESSLQNIMRLVRQNRRNTGRDVGRDIDRGRNGRRDHRTGRRNGYGRIEALQALERIENGAADSNSVFLMIEQDVESGLVSWEEGVQVYREVLSIAGGANSTNVAKTGYRNFVSSASEAGADITIALDNLKALSRAENSAQDTFESAKIALESSIQNQMNPLNSLTAMTTLTNAVGPNSTLKIRTTFRTLARKRAKGIIPTVNDFLEINRLENGIDDAIGNYELVLDAVRDGARYNRAFNAMKDLINQHGPNATNTIRRQFNLLFR